jgi:hypothetical protein
MERHPDSGAAHVSRVDGNALAGLFEDSFAVDVTTATAACRRCGARFLLAEAIVEVDEASAIVLCRSCTHTLFTLFRSEPRTTIVFDALAELTVES